MTRRVDLNADLGEGCGDDAAMLGVVSSANVACAAHAGDLLTLSRTVRDATALGVQVGAHIGYPDRDNFGRISMPLPSDELYTVLMCQLDAFRRVAGDIPYVKAHGALYNDAARDPRVATLLAEATMAAGCSLMLHQAGSAAERAASLAGIDFVAEAFADRAYRADGTLQPRNEPGAVLHDPALITERAMRMVCDGVVEAVDGTVIDIAVDSLCVHGDNPAAVAIAQALRAQLVNGGCTVTPFDRSLTRLP